MTSGMRSRRARGRAGVRMRRLAAVMLALAGSVVVPVATAQPAAAWGPDVHFYATSDAHLSAQCCSDPNNSLKGTYYDMNGSVRWGQLRSLIDGVKTSDARGVVLAGDMMSYTHKWEFFLYKSMIKGEGKPNDDQTVLYTWQPDHLCPNGRDRTCYPNGGDDQFVFDGFGNHDLAYNMSAGVHTSPNFDGHGPRWEVANRYRDTDWFNDHQQRYWRCWNVMEWLPNGERPTHDNCPHYSWDWGGVHFVQLHVAPTNHSPSSEGGDSFYPTWAQHFLERDLANNVGDSGRPVFVIHHYGFDAFSTGAHCAGKEHCEIWWHEEHRNSYWDSLAPYNVAGILTGHEHGEPRTIHWRRPDGKTNGPEFIRTFKTGSLQGTGDQHGWLGYFSDISLRGDTLSVGRKQVWADFGWVDMGTTEYEFPPAPPVSSVEVSPAPNEHGWNKGPVTLTFSGSDKTGVSYFRVSKDGGATWRYVTATTKLETEGVHDVRYYAVDNEGHAEAERQLTVRIDATPPVTKIKTLHPSEANEAGWNNSDVTVTTQCSDPLSGVAECPAVTLSADGTYTSVKVPAVDKAGNVASGTSHILPRTVKIDQTPPMIIADRAPGSERNEHGWNNDDVVIDFTCEDATSGVASCTDWASVTTEGRNQHVLGLARDHAGNPSSLWFTGINIDKTAPAITAARAPDANAHGWNNTDVVASFACEDGLSGVASCSDPVTFAGEGAGQNTTGFVEDKAGNRAHVQTAEINIDKTAPTIAAARAPAANEHGWNNTSVDVSFSCDDGLSGVLACSETATLAGEGAGQSADGRVEDLAGNVASTTLGGINIDLTAPSVDCSAAPSVLWPPNGRMHQVAASVAVQDALSGPLGFTLVSASSDQPDSGDPDLQELDLGTPDILGLLRAERRGGARTYTLGYEGSDRAGNMTACDATVVVPLRPV